MVRELGQRPPLARCLAQRGLRRVRDLALAGAHRPGERAEALRGLLRARREDLRQEAVDPAAGASRYSPGALQLLDLHAWGDDPAGTADDARRPALLPNHPAMG